MAEMCYIGNVRVLSFHEVVMAAKKSKRLSSAYNRKQNRLLRRLSSFTPRFRLGSYEITLLDLHVFPGHVDQSSLTHLHSFIEFHIPVNGAGHIIMNDKKYKFKTGNFTVTSPDQVHKWVATQTPMIAHIWWFEIRQLEEENNKDIQLLFDTLLQSPAPIHALPDEYLSIYDQLIHELENTGLCYQDVCRNLVEDTLILLSRAILSSRRKKTLLKNVDSLSEDHVVKLVNNFLEDNLSQPLLLDDIAKNAHISRRNLTRHYKKVTGVTIGQKLHELRMYKAEELIRETKLQVKAITYKCGFQHMSHFAKKFKEFFGFTPTEYREELLKQNLKGDSQWKPLYLNLEREKTKAKK